MEFIDKVKETIKKNNLINSGDRVLIGVSGGADSVCLLLILNGLKEEFKFDISVLHFHHMIRTEADKDAAFVEDLCKRLNVPFYFYKEDVIEYAKETGTTTEEAGRILRYKAFNECMKEHDINLLATAHHADDLAETMLLFLTRGTLLKGLSPIKVKNGNTIRPLLNVTKEEIKEYLLRNSETYCDDATNNDNDYSRNYIRNEIMPRLSKLNDKTTEHMVKTASFIDEATEILDDVVKTAESTFLRRENDRVVILNEAVNEKSYIKKSIIYNALVETCGRMKDIANIHVDEVLALFDKQVGRIINLPYSMIARREYDGVSVRLSADEADEATEKSNKSEINYKVRTFAYDGSADFPQKTYTKWFDYDIIKDNFEIRKVRDDDVIVVLKHGGSKKVADLLKDMKVPLDERKDVYVLATGNYAYWVIGIRMGEDAKITPDTKKILEITIEDKVEVE